MAVIRSFSDEQARLLVNLAMRYETWRDAERELAAMPYDLRRKTVSGHVYLYQINDRGGNGTSLGRMDENNQTKFDNYHAHKSALKDRIAQLRPALAESAALYRALRLPLLSSDAGPILRECDRRALLGETLLVVGTNAMAAYMVEANGFIDLPDETEDFDLAWVRETEGDASDAVWAMLKAVDPTFTINTERDFQARNAKAYEVELLVAPSRAGTLPHTDKPKPVPLPEQEWLLHGRPVDQVVGCRDGSPARIVAPDPRWFALHKLWMSEQSKRDPLKRPKDRAQGLALINAVVQAMPHYRIDANFRCELPPELAPILNRWDTERETETKPNW
jgi:hypothetical protein